MYELVPEVTVETHLDVAGSGPGSETAELARALRLIVPSLRDPDAVAVTIRNILRNHNVELVRMGVPFHG